MKQKKDSCDLLAQEEENHNSAQNPDQIKNKYDFEPKTLSNIDQSLAGQFSKKKVQEDVSEQRLGFIISNWDYKTYPEQNPEALQKINKKKPLKDLPAAQIEVCQDYNEKNEKNLELVLKDYGFRVKTFINVKADNENENKNDMENLGFKQIITHIQNKITEAENKNQDIVIFFAYMGHGFSKQSASNDLYALSYDYKAINIDFLGLLSRMSSRCRIIGLLDCCRSLMSDNFIDNILEKDLIKMKKYKSYEGALAFEQEYLILKAKISQVTVDRDNGTMAFKKVLQEKPFLALNQMGEEIQKVNQNIETQKGGKLLFKFQDPAFLKRKQIKLEKLLDCMEDYHGEDDFRNIQYMSELAEIYINLNNYGKAKQLLERNVKNKKKYKMESVSKEMQYLTEAYIGLGEKQKAQDLIQQSLEMYDKDIMKTSEILYGIGKAYADQGKYENAFEYFNKTLELQKKHYGTGENEIYLTSTLNSIGTVYNSKKQYDTALQYYENCLEIQKKFQDPNQAVTCNNIGIIYQQKGQYEKSSEYLLNSLKIIKQYFGEGHIQTADPTYSVGCCYYKQGRYDIALQYYDQCYKMYKNHYGEDHLETSYVYSGFGCLYQMQNQYDLALKYFNKNYEIFKKHYGEGHIQLASCYKNIGEVQVLDDKYEQGLENILKGFDITKKNQEEDHKDFAEFLILIGWVQIFQKKYEEALQNLTKSLEIFNKEYGENHIECADSLIFIGILKGQKGDKESEKKLLEQGLGIKKSFYGNDHQEVKLAESKIEKLQKVLG